MICNLHFLLLLKSMERDTLITIKSYFLTRIFITIIRPYTGAFDESIVYVGVLQVYLMIQTSFFNNHESISKNNRSQVPL